MAKLPKEPAETPQPFLAPGEDVRLALVTAEFNGTVTARMREDALETAKKLGAKILVDVPVPGVFDIPLTLSRVLARRDIDAAAVLGAVITGDTRHDEVVAFQCAEQVARLALDHGKPVGFGVTGPGQTEQQARARIDRGGWAVRSACSQFKTLRLLQKRDAGTA